MDKREDVRRVQRYLTRVRERKEKSGEPKEVFAYGSERSIRSELAPLGLVVPQKQNKKNWLDGKAEQLSGENHSQFRIPFFREFLYFFN